MDSAKAREIAIREATQLAQNDALPVCSGCPAGRFEESVDRWLKKLCNLMRQATFLEWRCIGIGAPHVMFVLQAEQKGSQHPFLEVPIARVDTRTNPSDLGGSERRLAVIGHEADEIRRSQPADAPVERDLAERDRIAEILENQGTIIAGQRQLLEQLELLRGQFVKRDSVLQGLVQRTLLLVNHYGRSPLFGKWTDLFGRERDMILERPGPEENAQAAQQAGKVENRG